MSQEDLNLNNKPKKKEKKEKKGKKENRNPETSKNLRFEGYQLMYPDLGMENVSKAVQLDFEEAVPNYIPLTSYWALMAARRQAQLQAVIEDNKRLYKLKETLLEINKYFRELLMESDDSMHDIEDTSEKKEDGNGDEDGDGTKEEDISKIE